MTARILAVLRFCYDFVVGDDWRVAVAVVAALTATALVATTAPAWWILPVVVVVVLPASLWPATRHRQ